MSDSQVDNDKSCHKWTVVSIKLAEPLTAQSCSLCLNGVKWIRDIDTARDELTSEASRSEGVCQLILQSWGFDIEADLCKVEISSINSLIGQLRAETQRQAARFRLNPLNRLCRPIEASLMARNQRAPTKLHQSEA